MKLFVAMDIHGSAYWTERIVDKFRAVGADAMILLGDIYNHGPRNPFPRDYDPMRTAELLNGVADRIIAVNGNCDSEVDRMISEFPFVGDCILPWQSRRLYFTHGHIFSKHNLPKLAEGDVLIYGHFHVNDYAVVSGIHCINVSSAALPKDVGAYCIVDDDGASVYDFDDGRLIEAKF